MGRRETGGTSSLGYKALVMIAWMAVGWVARVVWEPTCPRGGAHDLRGSAPAPPSPIAQPAIAPVTSAPGSASAPVPTVPSTPSAAVDAAATANIPPATWARGAVSVPVMARTESGFFARIRDWGFQPRTIIDVGANQGSWAKSAWADFGAGRSDPPRLLMVEGSSGREQTLAATGFPYAISVVGREARFIDFYDNPNANTGNSVLRERSHHFASTSATRVPMRTLDGILETAPGGAVVAPALLKLDVQGYELEVLRGATRTLEAVEVVILESSVIEYNAGAPLVAEVMGFMHGLGFVAMDMLEQHHHNGALAQLDFAYVKRGSKLLEQAAAAAKLTPV